jgi:pyrroloquinoline quinone biosynthesis protein D
VRLHEDRHVGEVVLLYPEGVLRLNETGRAILSLCDGRRTLDDIAAALASTFEETAGALPGDVADFLGQLSDRRLVRLGPDGGTS